MCRTPEFKSCCIGIVNQKWGGLKTLAPAAPGITYDYQLFHHIVITTPCS
jgi:hypothetical protein